MATRAKAAASAAVPSTVEELNGFLVELLDHVNLRDAGEQARLRSLLTGEEVPSADEASDSAGDGAGGGADDPASGE